MENRFDVILPKLEGFRLGLKPLNRTELKTLNDRKGVYVFCENDTPVYVGKTNNLTRRLKEHSNTGSKNNDANFAFKVAKAEWQQSQSIAYKKETRKLLEKNPLFKKIFNKAKERVSKMDIKYIEIEDPHQQYLFEFYAALYYETQYNEFKNH